LLSTLGAFSVARHEGMEQIAPAVTPAARQLQKRLLLLSAPASIPEGLKETKPGSGNRNKRGQ